jgi:hypothetical protein
MSMIGTPCGGCQLGVYACGDFTGFYTDDGHDFPCASSGANGVPADCSAASLAASQYCSSC